MLKKTLYFDYNATTPTDPEVVQAMLPYFSEKYGNSMSLLHSYGWEADSAVENSRQIVAKFFHCSPQEITWTSGATESNNWAIHSLVEKIRQSEGSATDIHILSSPVEHNSVLQALKHLENLGLAKVEFLKLDSTGAVDLQDLQARLRPRTRLVCAMWVQNEIGTINPMAKISALCRANKTYLLSDATQAVGKVKIDLSEIPVDFLSISSHKFYGPKGVGLLYTRSKDPHVEVPPLIWGGGHEQGRRSGTLNVPGIVGTAKAIELCDSLMDSEVPKISELRNQLFDFLKTDFPNLKLNGPPWSHRSANNLNLTFTDFEIPDHLNGLAISRGSACMSGKTTTSHVLTALGLSVEEANRTLRLSLGRWTTVREIRQAAEIIKKNLKPSRASLAQTEKLV